jgi:RecB family exonuclease
MCPLRYKAQYIDKIYFPHSIETFVGVVVHSALEYMFKDSSCVPSIREVMQRFEDMWQKKFTNDNHLHAHHHDEAVEMIRQFYETNTSLHTQVFEVEMHFSLMLSDSSQEETHSIHGYIDRIDKISNSEEYEIIDYKTGRFVLDEIDVTKDMQLGIYALALRGQFPLFPPEKIVTSIYAVRQNKKISHEPTDEDLEALKREVLKTIHAITKATQNNYFRAIKNRHCEGCPLYEACPAWR